MEHKKNRGPLVMLISSMLIWGTIGVFRRYIPLSSAFLAFTRGMMGGLFMLLFCILKRGKRGRIARGARLTLLIAGALIGLNWILLFEAYEHTSVAVATLCYYMQPTIVMCLSPLIFKERLTGRQRVCALLSVAGMVLVSGVIGDREGRGDLQGVLMGLGAAVLYSAVVILNKRVADVDPYQRTTVELLLAGLVMVPYLILTGDRGAADISLNTIVLTAAVGLVHTGLAYAMYFGSMDRLSVRQIAVFSYIDPVSALFFSALLLREPLSPLSLLGAVLIIGSAILSETGKQASNAAREKH